MNLGIRKKLYLIDLYLQTNGERLFGSEFEFKLNGPLDVQEKDAFGVTRPGGRISQLNLVKHLSDLGYSKVESGDYHSGIPAHYHISDDNSLVLVIDERGFLYDNKTPRCQVDLMKKCAKAAGLKLYIVNKDVMWNKREPEDQKKYLQQLGIGRKMKS